jgi:hypothetical protein
VSNRLKLSFPMEIDRSTPKWCSAPKIKKKRTDVKPNNQHNLEACKSELHFAIHPNKQKIRDNQKESKHSNPHCRVDGRPELFVVWQQISITFSVDLESWGCKKITSNSFLSNKKGPECFTSRTFRLLEQIEMQKIWTNLHDHSSGNEL